MTREQLDTVSAAAAGRYRPYPVYRDSGVKWLGEIPAHWEAKRLKYLLVGPLTYGANEPAEIIDRSLPRYIRITDIRVDGALRQDNFRSLPEEIAKPYLLSDGDILFARSGATVGKTFRYIPSWGRAAYAGYLIRARTDECKVQSDFVSYFSQSQAYWDWLFNNFIQATIQNVSAERYANLWLSIPSVCEQRVIATFLSRETAKIDALVAKKERLVELLQEKRITLITRAVTKGLDPDVSMKNSGVDWLEEVPVHWQTARTWQVSESVSWGTPSREVTANWDGSIPWVSPKDMKRRIISDTEEKISELGLNGSGLKLVQPPAVLVVVRGMILAHSFPVGLLTVPATINQDMKSLRVGEGIEPRFFAWLLDGASQHILSTTIEKAGHGTRAVRTEQWRSVELPIPPFSEQGAISNHLDRETAKIDALVVKVREAIDRLKELRAALISAAVTGKIDVRGASAGAG